MSLIAARQAIADARGDLDALVALEAMKHPNQQNPLSIAELLLAGGRAKDALAWVRRDGGRRIGFATQADMADGAAMRDVASHQRVSVEARILEALGEDDAAQALRWSAFAETLDAAMLREHVAHLDDFAEFDVLDRAFAHALQAPHAHRALTFFIAWPRLDLAARLVLARHAVWNGRHYEILLPAAAALEETDAAAASVLYRALLDNILAQARSTAYGHAADYLDRLDALAAAADTAGSGTIDNHAAYRARLLKAHGRKAGFWMLVKGKP